MQETTNGEEYPAQVSYRNKTRPLNFPLHLDITNPAFVIILENWVVCRRRLFAENSPEEHNEKNWRNDLDESHFVGSVCFLPSMIPRIVSNWKCRAVIYKFPIPPQGTVRLADIRRTGLNSKIGHWYWPVGVSRASSFCFWKEIDGKKVSL